MQLIEHRHSFKEGLLEKSNLPQYAYKEEHEISWDEYRILGI
jgi:hypothetical protein